MSATASPSPRRICLSAIVAISAALVAGCGPERVEQRPAFVDHNAGPRMDTPSDAQQPQQRRSAADGLYAQAERDVEAFLQHRRDRQQRQNPTGESNKVDFHNVAPQQPARQASTGNGRKAPPIVWNGTGGTTNVIPEPSVSADASRQEADRSSEKVLARPEPQGNELDVAEFPDRIEPTKAGADAQRPDKATNDAERRQDSAQQSNEEPTEREEPGGGVETLGPTALEQVVVDLSRELYQQAAYADMPLRELLVIAATSMVDPDRAIEPSAIPGLTDREREVLSQFQRFFATLGRELDGSREADEVLTESLNDLREALDQTPPLQIATAALCTSVRGFGDYTPFNKYAFMAQEQQQAVVYIEIENFNSRTNDKGDWVTELSQELTIYSDRDGLPVWSEPWQKAVDVSRKQRHDFFTVQIVTLPKALSVGKYYFKIRVRDENTDALAEHSIPFELVADPRMAVKIP